MEFMAEDQIQFVIYPFSVDDVVAEGVPRVLKYFLNFFISW